MSNFRQCQVKCDRRGIWRKYLFYDGAILWQSGVCLTRREALKKTLPEEIRRKHGITQHGNPSQRQAKNQASK